MDPITAAGTFAQIVGLMADFAASRAQRQTLEIKDFLEWLGDSHGELRTLIERNQTTSTSIRAAFAEGSQRVLERLEVLEGLLASLASGQGPLGQVAMSLVPTKVLSAQQLAILESFDRFHAGKALLLSRLDQCVLTFLDGDGSGAYGPDEPRFFETDLSGLVDLKLLDLTYNGSGNPVYHLTRIGHEIAKLAPGTDGQPADQR